MLFKNFFCWCSGFCSLVLEIEEHGLTGYSYLLVERMESRCDYCSEGRATVYCKADSARLCLSCDRHVHSANALSVRHVRTLLCDGCTMRPATLRCQVENISLCSTCDWEIHGKSGITNQHKRHTFESFAGCPTAAELASLWGCDFPGRQSVKNLPRNDQRPGVREYNNNQVKRNTWGPATGSSENYGPLATGQSYGASPDNQSLGAYVAEQQQRIGRPMPPGSQYGGQPYYYPQMGNMGPPVQQKVRALQIHMAFHSMPSGPTFFLET